MNRTMAPPRVSVGRFGARNRGRHQKGIKTSLGPPCGREGWSRRALRAGNVGVCTWGRLLVFGQSGPAVAQGCVRGHGRSVMEINRKAEAQARSSFVSVS